MRCKRCSSMISEGWSYCPSCGAKAQQGGFMDFLNIGLEDIFNKFTMQSLDELFRSANAFEPRYSWQQPGVRSRGISVKIIQSGSSPPVINVERFGAPAQASIPRTENPTPALSESAATPKTIIEPKIDIMRLPQRIVIEAEVPGIKSEEDATIMVLNESLEMRAPAGDIMYFKVVQIPPNMRIAGKTLSRGKLRIELGQQIR